MKTKTGILVAGLAMFLLVGGGCAMTDAPAGVSDNTDAPAVEDTSPIKIGWLGPLTGDVSSVGSADRDGATLAVKEVNEAGGINGRMLEVVYEDGGCESKMASTAGNKLINVEQVVAIVGGLCTGETMAVAPTAEEKKVVMVSPGSTAPSVTEAGDYIFRVVASDDYQGAFAAEATYNMGKRKAAVLYGVTDFHKGLADAFVKRFEELGGQIVASETYLQESRDLKGQLTKIKNSGADVLYFATYTEAGVVGIKQAQELEVGLQIVGAEPFDSFYYTNIKNIKRKSNRNSNEFVLEQSSFNQFKNYVFNFLPIFLLRPIFIFLKKRAKML